MRYLCVELLTKVGKQVLISICCFTVKPHNMIRTLADPVTNKLQDTIEAGLLLTHMQMNSVFQVLLSLCWLLSKTYPSRDAIILGIIERWIQVNTLNFLHSENETHKQTHQPYKPQQLPGLSPPQLCHIHSCVSCADGNYKILNIHFTVDIVYVPLQMIRANLLPECRCSILEMSPVEILKSPVYNTVPWDPSNRNLRDTVRQKKCYVLRGKNLRVMLKWCN